MPSLLEELSRVARNPVQVYDPRGALTRAAPRAVPVAPAASRFAGIPRSGSRLAQAAAEARAQTQQQQQAQSGWRGALGSVAGSPLGQAVLKPLDFIDMARRGVVLGVEELGEAAGLGIMDQDPDTRSNWEKFTDPSYGFGDIIEDTGNKWLDRAIGFTGDVLLDPTTYLTAGVAGVAGKTGRLGLAGRAAMEGLNLSDEALERLGRYGAGRLTAQELTEAGLQQQGIRWGVGRAKVRIPGTEGIARGVNKGTTAMRDLLNRAPGARTLRSTRAYEGIEDASERLLTGRVNPANPMSARQAAAEIGWSNVERLAGKGFRGPFARAQQLLVRGLPKEDNAAVAATHAAEALGDTPWNDFFTRMADKAESLGVKIDRRKNFIPHIQTPEWRAFIASSRPEAKAIRKAFGIKTSDLTEASGVTLQRKIVPRAKPYKFGDIEFHVTDGSIDGLNKMIQDTFPGLGIKMYEDDIRRISAYYVEQLSQDVGRLTAAKQLAGAGSDFVKNEGDKIAFKTMIDEAATKSANEAAAKRLDTLHRSQQGAINKLREAQRTGMTQLTDALKGHVQTALDETRTLRTPVKEQLDKLVRSEQTMTTNRAKVVKAFDDTVADLDRQMSDLNERLAKLEADARDELEALAEQRKVVAAERAPERRRARAQMKENLAANYDQMQMDRETLVAIRDQLAAGQPELQRLRSESAALGAMTEAEQRQWMSATSEPIGQRTRISERGRAPGENMALESNLTAIGKKFAARHRALDDEAAQQAVRPSQEVIDETIRRADETLEVIENQRGALNSEIRTAQKELGQIKRGDRIHTVETQMEIDALEQELSRLRQFSPVAQHSATRRRVAAEIKEIEDRLVQLYARPGTGKPETLAKRMAKAQKVIDKYNEEGTAFKRYGKKRTVSADDFDAAVRERSRIQNHLNDMANPPTRTEEDLRGFIREANEQLEELDKWHKAVTNTRKAADQSPERSIEARRGELRVQQAEEERLARKRASGEGFAPQFRHDPSTYVTEDVRPTYRSQADIQADIDDVMRRSGQVKWAPPAVKKNVDTPENTTAKRIRAATDEAKTTAEGSSEPGARAQRVAQDGVEGRKAARWLNTKGAVGKEFVDTFDLLRRDLAEALGQYAKHPTTYSRERLQAVTADLRRYSEFALRYKAAIEAGVDPHDGVATYITRRVIEHERDAINQEIRGIKSGNLGVVDYEAEQMINQVQAFAEDVSNADNAEYWTKEIIKAQNMPPAERLSNLRDRVEFNEEWQADRRSKLPDLEAKRDAAEAEWEATGGQPPKKERAPLPERTPEQQAIANKRATEARLTGAETKRRLHTGELSITDVFNSDQMVGMGNLTITDVLRALPESGRVRADRVLREARVPATRKPKPLTEGPLLPGKKRPKPRGTKVRELSNQQKEAILRVLRENDVNVEPRWTESELARRADYRSPGARRYEGERQKLAREIEATDSALNQMREMVTELETGASGYGREVNDARVLIEQMAERDLTEDEMTLLRRMLGPDRAETLMRFSIDTRRSGDEMMAEDVADWLESMMPSGSDITRDYNEIGNALLGGARDADDVAYDTSALVGGNVGGRIAEGYEMGHFAEEAEDLAGEGLVRGDRQEMFRELQAGAMRQVRDRQAEATRSLMDTLRLLGLRPMAGEGAQQHVGFFRSRDKLNMSRLRQVVTDKLNRDRGVGSVVERRLDELDQRAKRLDRMEFGLGKQRRVSKEVPPYEPKLIKELKVPKNASAAKRAEIDLKNQAILRHNENELAKQATRQARITAQAGARGPARNTLDWRTALGLGSPSTRVGERAGKATGSIASGGVSAEEKSLRAELGQLLQQQERLRGVRSDVDQRLADAEAADQSLQTQLAEGEQSLFQREMDQANMVQQLESRSLTPEIDEQMKVVRQGMRAGREEWRESADAIRQIRKEQIPALADEVSDRLRQIDPQLAQTREAILQTGVEVGGFDERLASLIADHKVLSEKFPENAAEVAERIRELQRIAADRLDTGSERYAVIEQMLNDAAERNMQIYGRDLNRAQTQKFLAEANAGKLTQVTKQSLNDNFEPLFKELTKDGEGLAIAKDFARGMRNVEAQLNDGKIWKAVEGYTNFFKTYATATPGFHIRNAISSAFMNATEGVRLRHTMESFRLWRDFRKDPTGFIDGLDLTTKQGQRIHDAFRATFGSGAGGQFAEPGVGVGGKLFDNAYTRLSRRAGEWVEGPARLALALHTMDQPGGNALTALDRISRVHFDYSQVSKWDRKAKRIVPFWTFMSRNLPLQLTQMWLKPATYQHYNSFVRNFAAENQQLVPSYWLEQGAFATDMEIGGDPMYLAPDLPHTRVQEDIARLGDPKRLLSQLNPLFRVPLETGVAGRKLYTDIPFAEHKYEPMDAELSLLAPLFAALGQVKGGTEGPVVSEKGAYAARQLLPPLQLFSRLFPSEGDTFNENRQEQTIARFFGLPVYQLNEQAQRGEANRQLAQRRDALEEQLAILAAGR